MINTPLVLMQCPSTHFISTGTLCSHLTVAAICVVAFRVSFCFSEMDAVRIIFVLVANRVVFLLRK